jgi:hypothetical protein
MRMGAYDAAQHIAKAHKKVNQPTPSLNASAMEDDMTSATEALIARIKTETPRNITRAELEKKIDSVAESAELDDMMKLTFVLAINSSLSSYKWMRDIKSPNARASAAITFVETNLGKLMCRHMVPLHLLHMLADQIKPAEIIPITSINAIFAAYKREPADFDDEFSSVSMIYAFRNAHKSSDSVLLPDITIDVLKKCMCVLAELYPQHIMPIDE